ncbi:MAG: DUF3576 domain-containing protein [Rhodobacteraceae bacterium]|nr:DUF3576 domain-containing protein [Paracoccaceae bacterium]
MSRSLVRGLIFVVLSISLAACGGFGGSVGGNGGSGRSSSGILGGGNKPETRPTDYSEKNPLDSQLEVALGAGTQKNRKTIWDLFISPDQNTNVRVNKYLWNASLETLNFLPVESADPFTGVLVMGWGRAPGSSRQYKAVVLVQDPALDARSLKLSIQTRSGPASAETTRRIEDAILTRARQLRIRSNNL